MSAASIYALKLSGGPFRDLLRAQNLQSSAPDLRRLLEMAKVGAGWTVLLDYLCTDAITAGQLAMLPTPGTIPENALYLAWNRPALRHPPHCPYAEFPAEKWRTTASFDSLIVGYATPFFSNGAAFSSPTACSSADNGDWFASARQRAPPSPMPPWPTFGWGQMGPARWECLP